MELMEHSPDPPLHGGVSIHTNTLMINFQPIDIYTENIIIAVLCKYPSLTLSNAVQKMKLIVGNDQLFWQLVGRFRQIHISSYHTYIIAHIKLIM